MPGNLILCQNAGATGAKAGIDSVPYVKTYSATSKTSTGAGTAGVAIEGSADGGTTWKQIGTISLVTSDTATSDGFTSEDRYPKVRANVTALTGTQATVTVYAGY